MLAPLVAKLTHILHCGLRLLQTTQGAHVLSKETTDDTLESSEALSVMGGGL